MVVKNCLWVKLTMFELIIDFLFIKKLLFLEKQYCKRLTKKEFDDVGKQETTKALVELANSLIDDATISLKEKKTRLKTFQQIYPDLYEKNFSNLF